MRNKLFFILLLVPIALLAAEERDTDGQEDRELVHFRPAGNGDARSNSPFSSGIGGTWHLRRGALSPTTSLHRKQAEPFVQTALRCARSIERVKDKTPSFSATSILMTTASTAGTLALAAQKTRIARTRSLTGSIGLMIAGATAMGGFLAIWEGDRIRTILGLKHTLEDLKAELITMQDEVGTLKESNQELLERVDGVDLLSDDVRQGLASVKLVSGDNARLSDIMLQIIAGYRELEGRMREMALSLPEEEQEKFLKPCLEIDTDRDMSKPADFIPEEDAREMERAIAVKKYNRRFKVARWNRVDTFEEIPQEIRERKYAHLIT